jgi:hypothetical protein
MLPYWKVHKYTWTCADGKAQIQIYHILIDRRRHSSVLDVRSFRAADCDTDHYLVVAKIRERLTVNKQRLHKLLNEKNGVFWDVTPCGSCKNQRFGET